MKIFIILILIFILYIILKKVNLIEYYDTKIENIDFHNCGNTCSRIYGCYSIGFNEHDNTCYLSNKLINNIPLPANYSGEFKPENLRCHKITSILSPNSDLTPDMYRDNITYDCHVNINDELGYKYFGDKLVKDITNKDRILLKQSPYDLYLLDHENEGDDSYNWEDLPRIPLTYVPDYQVKINDVKYSYELNNDIKLDNKTSDKLETYKPNIDLEKCKDMCNKYTSCKAIEYIDNITINKHKYNNVCSLKNSDKSKTNDNSKLYVKKQ